MSLPFLKILAGRPAPKNAAVGPVKKPDYPLQQREREPPSERVQSDRAPERRTEESRPKSRSPSSPDIRRDLRREIPKRVPIRIPFQEAVEKPLATHFCTFFFSGSERRRRCR